MHLPSKRLKFGASDFDVSMQEIDDKMQPLYRSYTGLDSLLPDGLANSINPNPKANKLTTALKNSVMPSQNNLSLLLNNM